LPDAKIRKYLTGSRKGKKGFISLKKKNITEKHKKR
jgi:hypothetical protein